MIKFLVTLSLVTCLILAVGFWGFEVLPGFFYKTVGFLFISTVGLFRFLYRTKQQRPDYFVQFYLATLVVKLIAFGGYAFWMALSKPEEASVNIAFFMAVYFLFTAIEIAFLYRLVNR